MYAIPNILLVEDHEALHRAQKEVLEAAGAHVLSAHDGPDAIRKFRDHHDSLHAIVVDFGLPEKHDENANALKFLDIVGDSGEKVYVIGVSSCPEGQASLKQHFAVAKVLDEKKYVLEHVREHFGDGGSGPRLANAA